MLKRQIKEAAFNRVQVLIVTGTDTLDTKLLRFFILCERLRATPVYVTRELVKQNDQREAAAG